MMTAAQSLERKKIPLALNQSRFKLFEGLDFDALELLEPAFSERVFQEEEILLRIGESSQNIFFIIDGAVKVEIPLVNGSSVERIATLQAGNTAGEFALVRQGRITAQVTAISEVSVFCTESSKLQKILLNFPSVGCQVYRNLSAILVDRLVDTNLLARNVLSQISLF